MVVNALDPTWINAPAGVGPSYDAEELRRAQGFTLASGVTPGSARTGVLNIRDLALSLSGTNVRAGSGGAVIGTAKGAYVSGLAATTTIRAYTAADVTNPRRDRIVLEILDPDNGGGAGRKAQLRVIDGTPHALAASGSGYPAEPPLAITLGYLDVPKVGGGNPALTAQPPITTATGAPVPVRSQAERDALPKWDGLRVLRLDQSGILDVCMGGSWSGPTEAFGAVSPNGYSTTGNVIVENRGSRKQVTVDITITRTGSAIGIGTDWSGFGQVLATAVLGTSPVKYLAAWLAGGGNNISVGVSLNPATGVMSIRGQSAFSWTTGALFSINCTYYI